MYSPPLAPAAKAVNQVGIGMAAMIAKQENTSQHLHTITKGMPTVVATLPLAKHVLLGKRVYRNQPIVTTLTTQNPSDSPPVLSWIKGAVDLVTLLQQTKYLQIEQIML